MTRQLGARNGVELDAEIYSIELSVMSPSRLRRAQKFGASNDDAETCKFGASDDGAELKV